MRCYYNLKSQVAKNSLFMLLAKFHDGILPLNPDYSLFESLYDEMAVVTKRQELPKSFENTARLHTLLRQSLSLGHLAYDFLMSTVSKEIAGIENSTFSIRLLIGIFALIFGILWLVLYVNF
jgi:hypothetical protein